LSPSLVCPARSSARVRVTAAPMALGSVAPVAVHGLSGAVMSSMSAVEMSAPYTLTLPLRFGFCSSADSVALVSSS